MDSFVLLAYAAPLVVVWVFYIGWHKRKEIAAQALYAEAVETGLDQPASLHPLIDPAKCLGCGACVRACPEGRVIGLISGKAVLIQAADCIGHGACKAACPFDAITLVFGTKKRGVDIPEVRADFQTNVPGIFIAGELGGMGLIRNAVEQGKQAIDGIAGIARQRRNSECDVLIVGAGPAGLAAGLAATEKGLRFHILEQETFGGTVAHFPRGKIVMTQPMRLPIVGKMRFREVSKEELLAFWADVLKQVPLPISYGERVENIEARGDSFLLQTTRGERRASTVLLAIGRRGTPRKLGVPGEVQGKVVYSVADPAQYKGLSVLVVGGGDSALEAAADIAGEPGTTVTLSYRSSSFTRAKAKNRQRIEYLQQSGRVRLLLSSNIIRIGASDVEIECGGVPQKIANDAVVVCAGGVLPTKFLRDSGVHVETKYGTA